MDEGLYSQKMIRILIAAAGSPTDVKKILKAPHRDIPWSVDLKKAARLIGEEPFDILIIEPRVIENWPDKIALANYVNFIEHAKEMQPGMKVILAGIMAEEILESEDCRHYPASDGRRIYQEKGRPQPDYVVNVAERLPGGVVSISYERVVAAVKEAEKQLKSRKTPGKPEL